MTNTTTRRDLLRLGTTAAAYAAGASIVTGGIALASQAKGAALEGEHSRGYLTGYTGILQVDCSAGFNDWAGFTTFLAEGRSCVTKRGRARAAQRSAGQESLAVRRLGSRR